MMSATATRSHTFTWEDPRPDEGRETSFYYVRVLQRNGQIAWGSPTWLTR